MAANELCSPIMETVQSPIERVDSEYECNVMIEALSKELTVIRDHLAFLTHRLYTDTQKECPPVKVESAVQSVPVSNPRVVSKQLRGDETRRRGKKAPDYLSVVDRVESERAQARREYLVLMETHIKHQLEALRRRAELLRRRLVSRQQRMREAKLKLKPARYRSSGQDDHSFLGNVYLSNFYRIVGEEHRLRKAGHLQTQSDLKVFWDSMLGPLVKTTPIFQRATPINQSMYDGDGEECTNSWAITALPPERVNQPPPDSIPPYDLEFVPSVLPKLRSVGEILDQGNKLKLEIMLKQASHHHNHDMISEVVLERRKLRSMYQQARANEIFMRKLLPSLPNFDLSPPPAASSLTLSMSPLLATQLPDSIQHLSTEQHPPQSNPTEFQITKKPQPHPPTSPPPAVVWDSMNPDPQSMEGGPAPLSMKGALQDGRIIESKCKSSLWTNFVTV